MTGVQTCALPISMSMIAESIYENYNGNTYDTGFSSDTIEKAVYTATYNAVSAALGNSTILRQMLTEVQNGHEIKLDGNIVAESTRRIANAYTSSQGEPYFEI